MSCNFPDRFFVMNCGLCIFGLLCQRKYSYSYSLRCVSSIDFVSHLWYFVHGYNKTWVNLQSNNPSCECKKSSTHPVRLKGWKSLETASFHLARDRKQKNVELSKTCSKFLRVWRKVFKYRDLRNNWRCFKIS